jgi:hypothetical protein
MAFKTFAPGVLTSSDVNTFLMRQSVIVCTSTTRPASPSEGMLIYETDTDETKIYSGSAWEVGQYVGAWDSYTPSLGGTGWSFGSPTIVGRFMRVGRTVIAQGQVTWAGGVTIGSGPLSVTLPVTTSTAIDSTGRLGTGLAIDDSAAAVYPLFTHHVSSTAFTVGGLSHSFDADTVTFSQWNSTSLAAGLDMPVDANDYFTFSMQYEAAA